MTVGAIVRIVGITAVCLAILAVVVQVEDWGRDFTTNHARSAEGSPDRRLRPLRTEQRLVVVKAAIRRAAAALPGWREATEKGEITGPISELYFVRTTPIFRFEDDVTVYVKQWEHEKSIEIESRSRVGKGDLGQNPRNVRMLHYRLEQELARLPPPESD